MNETRFVKPSNNWQLVIPAETEMKEPGNPVEKFWQHAVRRLSMVPRDLSVVTPDTFGLPFEAVDFPSRDGLRLSGWYMPTKNSPATIIVAHGYQKSKANYLEYAQWLKWAGYGVFIFDFRAHGYSEGPKGTSIGYMERLDVLGAVDYLRWRGVERIGLLGVSMGAAASIMAASENPYIRAVIADSSYAYLYRSITTQAATLYRIPRWPGVHIARIAAKAMAAHHGYDPTLANPADHVGRIVPRPLLIIHGDADSLTEPDNSKILHQFTGGQAQLWTVPGVEHALVYKTKPEEYRQRALAFFDGVNWKAAPLPYSHPAPRPAPYPQNQNFNPAPGFNNRPQTA